ncbi:hypothetical protein BGX38DRAFT_1145309 [Terfezia claveryi]|nr:hypothetical protein BGX38DRAFT_1145309 [Terfezia claveryi]
MSEVQTNLRHQLMQFLQYFDIMTDDENDKNHWHFWASECRVAEDGVTRLVDSIVKAWVDEGVEDILEFQNIFCLSLHEVVTMVESLVKTQLGRHLGDNMMAITCASA